MVTPLLNFTTDHQDVVHDAKLDYYGKLVATASSDKSVKVYEIVKDQSYQLLADFRGNFYSRLFVVLR